MAPAPVTVKNFASRNRKSQREFRQQQLIEATLDCIDKLGISQTTLARIAERAGLSQGNVVFHFQSKEALLDQTLRFLDEEYLSNWQTALAAAEPDVTTVRHGQGILRAEDLQSSKNQRLVCILGRITFTPQVHACLWRERQGLFRQITIAVRGAGGTTRRATELGHRRTQYRRHD